MRPSPRTRSTIWPHKATSGSVFDIPEYTADITGVGAARILEAIIESGIGKKVRFYQASSSEMYGKVQQVPQTERTPFWPRSPYGCAKAFAYFLGSSPIIVGEVRAFHSERV